MRYTTVIVFIILFTALLGCITPAGLITKAITGGGAPTVQANIGGKAGQQVASFESKQDNRVEKTNKQKIKQAEGSSLVQTTTDQRNTTNNTNIPIWVLLVACAGWLLPGVQEIIVGLGKMICWAVQGVIQTIKTIKGG